jgi:hypothetical protein
VKQLGSGNGRNVRYGTVASGEAMLHTFGISILKAGFDYAAVAIGAAAFPQFAGLIYSGYAAYKGFEKIHGMIKEYEMSKGSTEERFVSLAAREGCKILVGETIGLSLDRPTDQIIDKAVHTTTDIVSREGIFRQIATQSGLPDESSDDLRYFFMSTSKRSLKGAYRGARDELADYVAKGIIR